MKRVNLGQAWTEGSLEPKAEPSPRENMQSSHKVQFGAGFSLIRGHKTGKSLNSAAGFLVCFFFLLRRFEYYPLNLAFCKLTPLGSSSYNLNLSLHFASSDSFTSSFL